MEDFDEFVKMMETRLAQGEREYGNSSFSKPPAVLRKEIEEELLDVCLWSFILWKRVKELL